MSFDIGFATDVGRRRSDNEDYSDVLSLTDGALCIVADGMGGHQAGEVASRVAVDTIRETFRRADQHNLDALVGAVQAANRAVLDESAADSAKEGMGTTVVCALLENGRAQLANVGDSPAFLVRGDHARQVAGS